MAAKGVSFMVFLVTILAVDFAECADSTDCNTLNGNMITCLSFVDRDSKVSTPEASCCKGLEVVLKANATCLCEGFRQSVDMGLKINITKAMTLPTACKVSSAGVADCGLSPAAAPALPPSPSGGGAAPPTAIPTPGATDAEAPAPAPASPSGASSLTFSVGFLAIYLGAVVFF